ncbi:uncharacterized protein LOC131946160 [Physella acuta]|uniref:uncharacterized protein LOC131946160 n=1 Tax=Physella acuta TaxID=109671 RepID=UPI0027DB99CD|nr:uncharacterized protein LOC131946160 [Physella acuta]
MSIVYLILICLPALTMAQNVNLKPYNVTAAVLFLQVDTNMNNNVDKTELHASFLSYDTDGDGRITRHEYTTYVDAHSPALHPLSHALYDIYDVDGDHHLDEHDFDNFYGLMDTDNNGIVSDDEFIKYWEILFVDLEHLHGGGR